MSEKLVELRKPRAEVESIIAQRSPELENVERTLIEIAERESRRLGKVLHDTLCQQMLGAAFCAQALVNQVKRGVPPGDDLQDLAELLKAAVEQARNITHSVDPEVAEEPLVNALQKLVDLPRRGIKPILECSPSLVVSSTEVSLHLFRIAEEAVTNAVEHSGGTQVIVRLQEENGKICLQVDDDGSGCPNALENGAGIGLKLMKIRARTISAKLRFVTAETRGIRVECVVPT